MKDKPLSKSPFILVYALTHKRREVIVMTSEPGYWNPNPIMILRPLLTRGPAQGRYTDD